MSLKPQPTKKLIKALTKIDFKIVRTHGSHVILKHPDGILTAIPVHSGEEIGNGLLNKIIKRHRTYKRRIHQTTLNPSFHL